MTDFLQKTFLGNSAEQWLYAIGFTLGGILISRLLYFIFGKLFKGLASRTSSRLDDILVDKLEEPVVFAVMIIFAWWGYDYLHFEEGVQIWIQRIFKVLIAINLTWLVARLVDALISELLVPLSNAKESSSIEAILPIVRKGTKVIIWTLGIVLALNNAGYDVGALIAGVGIGGLAMAMAAKDFVANIFGGITVFLDKPFSVGDRIQIDSYDGFVKEIGIRTTRLQTLEGRVVIVPNYKFTDSFVTNVTAEPARRVKVTVGLEYGTAPEKMAMAREIMKSIASEHTHTTDEVYVWFESFGDFSLNLSMFYYIAKSGDLFDVPGEINMAILERFNAAELSFAFPTQTVHLSATGLSQGK